MDNQTVLSTKELHEKFVSHHNGTSLLEISAVLSIGPSLVLFRWSLIVLTNHLIMRNCQKQISYSGFAGEFVLLIFPYILLVTIFVEFIRAFLGTVFACGLSAFLLSRSSMTLTRHTSQEAVKKDQPSDVNIPQKLLFLTYFRSYVDVGTAISILAVDFIIFPRRFCKTETYGAGMMDSGVGLFVAVNALVSGEARCISSRCHSNLYKTIISTWPLWLLGLCRLMAVKSTDYHEHVSEYGVHWNFFFTLALVRILSSTIFTVISVRYSCLVGLGIAVSYQMALSMTGLTEYILHGVNGTDSRVGLLDANREGVFSTLGYLAIYNLSVTVGQLIFHHLRSSDITQRLRFLFLLIVTDLLLWVGLDLNQLYIEPVSRRLANSSFIIWMMACCLQLLSCFLLAEIACDHFRSRSRETPETLVIDTKRRQNADLLEAVNRNGLFYFLLANLLTGTINISMSTITASTTVALLVVSSYVFILCGVVWLLDCYDITLKLW